MTLGHGDQEEHRGGAFERMVASTPPPQDAADPHRAEVAGGAADVEPRSRSAGADYAPGRHHGRGGEPVAHHGTVEDAADTAAGAEPWPARAAAVPAPAILGLLGFAGATFMVASNLAGWWGNAVVTPLELAPFAATFGGLAQFLAGMWAYRARDGLGTAMHGTWGAFWLAYGLVAAGVATGRLPLATMASRAFGFWFIVLCVVTFFGTVAASRVSLALVVVLGLLTVGSGLLAAGLVGDSIDVVRAAGWVLVASAVAAFYTAGAMLLRDAWGGRAVLPVGERNAARQTW